MELENRRQENLLIAAKFLLRLTAIGLIFRAFIFFFPTFLPLQKAFAYVSASLLDLFIPEITRNGIDIQAGEWFRVTRDCTGWKSAAALTGISVASKSWSWKFLAKGFLLIASANVLRIVTVIYLDFAGVASFELTHGILWRWGLTALVLGYWLHHVRALDLRKNMISGV